MSARFPSCSASDSNEETPPREAAVVPIRPETPLETYPDAISPKREMETHVALLKLLESDCNGNHQWDLESWEAGFLDEDVILNDVRPMEEGKNMYIGWAIEHTGERADWVIKIRVDDEGKTRLEREADVYINDLAEHQNILVPVCLGLYKFKTALPFAKGAKALCLITLHTGHSVPWIFIDNEFKHRYNMINLVYNLHAAGLSHNNIREANFRLMDDMAMLIDLDSVTKHECPLPEMNLGGRVPWSEEFGCPELWSFCANLGFWQLKLPGPSP